MARRPEKLGKLVVGSPPGQLPTGPGAAPPIRSDSTFSLGIAVLVGAALVAAGVLGWQSGWLPAQFTPRKVVLRGSSLTPAGEVFSLVGGVPADSLFAWWRKAHNAKVGESRWLESIQPRLGSGRTLLLNITERLPILRVESAGSGYWLCADGRVEKARLEDHQLELFKAIKTSPVVRLDGVATDSSPAWTDSVTQAAASCNAVLPGQIRTIAVNARGELSLYDRGGLEIKLGAPEHLPTRIAALPKVLRALGADRSRIAFLDGRGKVAGSKFVFYEVRKEPDA